MNFSLTIGGLLGGGLVAFLGWAGITVGSEEVDGFIKVGGGILAAIAIWWGRVRRGDITWYGTRIK